MQSPSGAGELLTQLQDQLDNISRAFFESVGVLQRDAPPKSVAGEDVIPSSGPSCDVQQEVQAAAQLIIQHVQRTAQLLQLLPDNLVGKASTSNNEESPQQIAFTKEVKALQQEHQAVAQQLAETVQQVEDMLVQLQQLYAVLAHAKLQSRARTKQ